MMMEVGFLPGRWVEAGREFVEECKVLRKNDGLSLSGDVQDVSIDL